MRYWWVNQNQTFRQEIEGGYLWSPKRNKNGHRNPFYEFMREVAPGDIVFSFCDTRIAALGIVSGYCRESPKPEEFGTAGTNWSQIGWRVGVRWQRLANAIRPKDHIARLRPELGEQVRPADPGRQRPAKRLPDASQRRTCLDALCVDRQGGDECGRCRSRDQQDRARLAGTGAGHRGMGAAGRGRHRHRHGDPGDRENRARPGAARSGPLSGQRALDRARLPHHQGRAHGAPDRQPRAALARQQQRSSGSTARMAYC